MRKRLRISTLLVCAALAACGTDGTQPSAVVTTGDGPPMLLGSLPIFVEVLQRTTPLQRTYTATASIGAAGGRITIPEAGFAIDVPAGAVSGPVQISVKALPGKNVAYEFKPHGLRFARTPVITQDLRGTAAYGSSTLRSNLEGAYAPDLLGLLGGLLRILETRPTTVQVDTWQMRFTVEHFSGYVASAKRRSGYISSSGNLVPGTE
jgi:hypothetical protein